MKKAFIFDFDDTLYYGVNWSYWHQLKYDFILDHFKYLSQENLKKMLKEYDCYKKPENVNVIKILIDKEGSAQAWLNFRETLDENFDEMKKAQAVENSELEKFAKAGKCFIVSNSNLKGIVNLAKFFKIDLNLFDKIYVNDYSLEDITKSKYYQNILQKTNLNPKDVVVIGNNYSYDLQPAKDLGMKIYQCTNGFTYEEVMRKAF